MADEDEGLEETLAALGERETTCGGASARENESPSSC